MRSTVQPSRGSSERRRCARSASADELELDGIPAPQIVGRDAGAADPAVDAEQLDLVGLAVQRALTPGRQPQLKLREALAVTEWRRRRKRLAFCGLDEPPLSLPERRERSEKPRVAEKRRVLEPLRRDESGRRRRRARGDPLECVPFCPREPIDRRGEFLEQTTECGGEIRQHGALTCRQLRNHRPPPGLEGGPRLY